VELDRKILECRATKERIFTSAKQASKESRSMALRVSEGRSEVSNSVAGIPADDEEFQAWQDSDQLGHARCVKEHATLKQKEVALKHDAGAVNLILAKAKKKCGVTGFLQVEGTVEDTNAQSMKLGKLMREVSDLRRVVLRQRPALRRRLQAALLQSSLLAFRLRGDMPQKSAVAPAAVHLRAGRKSSEIRRRPELVLIDDSPLPTRCEFGRQVCSSMVEAIHEVAGEITDALAEVKDRQMKSVKGCEEDHKVDLQEIQATSLHKTELSTKLAEATGSVTSYLAQMKGKDVEVDRFMHELDSADKRCYDEIHALLYTNICGIQRLRDEMHLMGGGSELPEDCEVTEWVQGECSNSCGGGQVTLTREMVAPSWKGSECPPLLMQQTCGEAECPTDCSVSMWSGWTKCTAVCDGGTQQRMRNVETHSTGGGDACPELIQARLCNAVDCTNDCQLTKWLDWSECSQVCDGGSRWRRRHIDRPAAPGGTCPSDDSEERLQWGSCGEEACPDLSKANCSAATTSDVVLLVDTSGSLAEGDGFNVLRNLATAITRRYGLHDIGTHVGVAGFAGDTNLVSDLTDDGDALTATIEKDLTWTKGPSLLSHGLLLAKDMLERGGRKNGTWTVLVLTDGRIGDPFKADQAAQKLRAGGARLAFVPLTFEKREDGRPALMERLATEPPRQNIIAALSTAEGDKGPEDRRLPCGKKVDIDATANKVVLGTCSKMNIPEPDQDALVAGLTAG